MKHTLAYGTDLNPITIWTEAEILQLNPNGNSYVGDKSVFDFLGVNSNPAVENSNSSPASITQTAGRVCYMSFGKGRKTIQEYISNILSQGHGSVLEHVSVSFLVQGVSRSLTHELVRHRAGFAYSQLSQRYVDESEVGFVQPPELNSEKYPIAFNNWLRGCAYALSSYKSIIGNLPNKPAELADGESLKKYRQIARAVLPNCTETKLVVTANLRAWRHFIEMRASIHADAEIRNLAVLIYKSLLVFAPEIFADYTLNTNTNTLSTPYRKV